MKSFTTFTLLVGLGGGLSPVYALTDELEITQMPHFCGEPLPLHKSNVSRKFIKELNNNFVRSLPKFNQTARKYFKTIEPILAKHKIPQDFKYLCLIESTFDATTTSPKGASGYWQFMPETAREMGLEVNKKTDERHDLVKSTHAACRYFRYLYEQLGAWTLVAAAYNGGIARVNEYIRRTKSLDYYDWRASAETGQYLYRVIAVKEWFTAPERFQYWASMTLPAAATKRPNPKRKTMLVEVEVVEDSLEELEDTAIKTLEKVAETPKNESFQPPADSAVPLPNAVVSVLKVGANIPQKGQTWVFEITKEQKLNGQTLGVGDRLYAEVVAVSTNEATVELRCIQLYAPQRHQMYKVDLKTTAKMTVSVNDTLFWN
ncbi:MAG: lytic transglycosylase domain-containing protein [Spirosomaceae bacterium]|nr:lytic transglycosylase domain-containing protein [Spirosomataceae bacterium]